MAQRTRMFRISSGVVSISGLTLTQRLWLTAPWYNPAAGTNVDHFGGAIYMTGGALTLTGTTSFHNNARDGGGIYVDVGVSLTIVSSTLSGNRAEDGGAIVWLAGRF